MYGTNKLQYQDAVPLQKPSHLSMKAVNGAGVVGSGKSLVQAVKNATRESSGAG